MDTIADWLIGMQDWAATWDVLRLDLLGKLILATILRGVIGWEREASGKSQATFGVNGSSRAFRRVRGALGCAGLLQSVDAPGAAV